MNDSFSSVQRVSVGDADARAAQDYTAAEKAATEPRTSGGFVGDVARLIISNGQATSSIEPALSTNRATSAAAGVQRGGIIATAHSVNGLPKSGREIDPDKTLVEIDGMTTTVRAAAAAGYLRQNDNGIWIDAAGGDNTSFEPA